MSLMETIREHKKKLALGGVSLTVVLGAMWNEIKANDKDIDSVAVVAAQNTATLEQTVKLLDKLVDVQLRGSNVILDTVFIDTTKRDTT